MEVFNPNPVIFAPAKATSRRSKPSKPETRYSVTIHISCRCIALLSTVNEDLIRHISDPEHPNSLEELRVNRVIVEFTPTVPHCGMSTLIGLSIRVRLMQSMPPRFKVDIFVKPGSHQSEHAVNKQLNDKERVAAALENPALVVTVEKCLEKAESWGPNSEGYSINLYSYLWIT
ncbi:FAM96B protein [Salix suchowensis]|nr:FAM96B protein [Salix suchowensis]